MPVYLFTYHAYRSWMPDHKRGIVRRKEGVLKANRALSNIYKRQAIEKEVLFKPVLQRILIDEAVQSCSKQQWHLHFVATEVAHVHVLVSWRTSHSWRQVQISLKSSTSRRLNRDHGRRAWLSEGASRKRVRDKPHFDYLINQYLPKHSGWKWQEAADFMHDLQQVRQQLRRLRLL